MEALTYIIPLYRKLTESGYDVTVSHPRKTRLIAEARTKSDRVDSRALAELLRLRAQVLKFVHATDELEYDQEIINGSNSSLSSNGGFTAKFSPPSQTWTLTQIKLRASYSSGSSQGTFSIEIWDSAVTRARESLHPAPCLIIYSRKQPQPCKVIEKNVI
jgi:hypothetical protein